MRSESASVLTTGSESTTASTSGCCFRAWELRKTRGTGWRPPNVRFVSRLTHRSGDVTWRNPTNSMQSLRLFGEVVNVTGLLFSRCHAGELFAQVFSSFQY